MKRNEQDRRETNLKARMAESLVSDLLTEAGNDVYRLGQLGSLPNTTTIEDALAQNERLAHKIRAIPDFFVLDSKNKAHLVEVKFRWHPSGHENDLKKLRRIGELWEESLIVFVNCSEKPYFRVSHAPFVSKQGSIITAPLESVSSFRVSTSLIERFNELVVKYLTPTLFPNKN